MIFYFSGTGNSRWVAQRLAALTGDEARDIVGLETRSWENETRIGLVFPVYAWGAPEPVISFVRSLKAPKVFSFAVCTCGSEAGHAMKKLNAVRPFASCYSLVMPNNYIIGADVDDASDAKRKLEEASKEIQRMAEEIQAGRPVYRVKEGSLAGMKSGIINYGFNKFARSTRPFFVTDACNGCGLCAKRCPAQTIAMMGGTPAWGQQCYQCLRCINECPQRAIQYGKSTDKRGRYTIAHYLKEDGTI